MSSKEAPEEPVETTDLESFENLFQQTVPKKHHLKPGQKIEATVVGISDEYVFLDVGDKSEGSLDKKEVVDEQGNVTVAIGERLPVYFLSVSRNEKVFTTRVGASSVSTTHLESAFQQGIPVEGLVEKEIKGGFEIKVTGNIRAFCPYSQMGLGRNKNPEERIGQKLSFKITQFGQEGRNIVVSQRALLEEERWQQKEALKETLQVGMTVKGKITSIRDFGAFIDIGGVDGLIPISEIGWGRIDDINEFLTIGQEVEAVVLRMDWEKDQIALSLKQALADPWTQIETDFPEGSCHTGTVSRLAKFGAFITLAPGVDGLLHISKLGDGRGINHPREVVEEGQALEVRIEGVDKENRRISLDLAVNSKKEKQDAEQNEYQQYMKAAKQKSSAQSMGSLGDLLQAKIKGKEKK